MADAAVPLDAETRALVRVASSVATGDTAALKERLEAARAVGVAPRRVDELLLQSLLNVGYALGLQAFGVWREVSPAPAGDEDGERLAHEGWRGWLERGARVCEAVYGRTYHKLLVNLRGLHPALEALVVVDAYGKLIGRAGLDLKRRELCTLAEIAVLDTPRQLHAHMRGALNTGSTAEEVEEVLALVAQDIDEPHARRMREVWADVKGRRK
ncbi:MAG TPA: carboxymuconolactone decarboxylase family protein [Gemmatimonadales bacterium]|nr:carboxymuconolactone decarboxylase family protein [Gemmatimonadales bacterium]